MHRHDLIGARDLRTSKDVALSALAPLHQGTEMGELGTFTGAGPVRDGASNTPWHNHSVIKNESRKGL